MKTPDYLNYSRYKKKKNDTSKNSVMIFVTTFFAMLLVFTIIAKSLSPNVDVTIGDDSQTDAKESGLGVKRFIDDRLKMIQMEDDSAGVSLKDGETKSNGYNDKAFDNFSKQLDEKVTIPTGKQTATDNGIEEPQTSTQAITPPRPRDNDLSTPIETASPKMAKVFVGYYSNIEQAKVAQGILQDSGLNVTPFVKNLGGAYTLQVGSYSSRSKADGLASELLRNNFPARVIQE